MKNILFALLCFWSTVLVAQSGVTESFLISTLVDESDLSDARIGFCVLDLKSGEVVSEYDSDKAMIPASLMKISTTVAALQILGSDFTFKTKLYYSGKIEEGVLKGDIIIMGGGDPTLGSEFIKQSEVDVLEEFAIAIQQRNIHSINGKILVESSFFNGDVPNSWSWEDIGNYYAAPALGINFIDNRLSITLSSESAGTKAKVIKMEPEILELQIESNVVADNIQSDQAYCYAAPGENQMRIEGSIPANKQAFTIKAAIPQPELYFAQSLKNHLKNKGIFVKEGVATMKDGATLMEENILLVKKSPELSKIIEITNQYSVNLYAEAIYKMINKVYKIKKEGLNQEILAFWEGELSSIKGLKIMDGSGLSHYNTITSYQLCQMLRIASLADFSPIFKKSLPISGASGTLRNFGKGSVLENNFNAKSGYMTGSRGYSGYLRLKSGKEVAITIIANNYSITAYEMKSKMEMFLKQFAELN